METLVSSGRHLHFRSFEFDPKTHELYRRSREVPIRGHPAEILATLLEQPGEVVTRTELREKLWPDHTFVDFEHILNNSVNKLREALGDEAAAPRYIQTVPGLGYRFIAPVEHHARPRTSSEDRQFTADEMTPHRRGQHDPTRSRGSSSQLQIWWFVGAVTVILVIIGLAILFI